MAQLTAKKDSSNQSFSLKKIPLSVSNEDLFDKEDKKFSDKVKLLELSTLIDCWERETLFSENGFFSLKGKDVQNKSKEFINELEKFISSKMSKMTFSLEKSKLAARELKRIKIENIKAQLLTYEQKELYHWELGVYNDAILASHDKAIFYKNDINVVLKSVKNGIDVLKIMSEREKWNPKIFKIKKDKFISDCYFDIIKSFIEDKNILFIEYYNAYGKYILEEQKNELEAIVTDIKNNIIAHNWAVELFSYNLDDIENEKEIKNLKDQNLETAVRKYLDILKKKKKKDENNANKQEIRQIWDNIISSLDNQPEKALLYIDISKDKDIVKSQKEYIKQIVDKGFIETDKSKFMELFCEMIYDFSSFKEQVLDKYRHQLSKKDFVFFENSQNKENDEFSKSFLDYKFFFEKLKKAGIKNSDKQYDCILSYIFALEEYKSVNNKDTDFKKKNEIIETILDRNAQK